MTWSELECISMCFIKSTKSSILINIFSQYSHVLVHMMSWVMISWSRSTSERPSYLPTTTSAPRPSGKWWKETP